MDDTPIEHDRRGLTEGVAVAKDTRPGEWLGSRLLPSSKGAWFVGSVIPSGFAAYARVFHPAEIGNRRPASEVLRWREVAEWSGRIAHPEMQWEAISRPTHPTGAAVPWTYEPRIGHIPPAVRSALGDILAAHTTMPELCWMCIWEGYAAVGEALGDLPRVELPHRSYYLLHAPLDVVARKNIWVNRPRYDDLNIWWPDDRAWCVATEIDYCWTYVGGSSECIADVLADPRLEALPAELHQRGDYLSDQINGPVQPW